MNMPHIQLLREQYERERIEAERRALHTFRTLIVIVSISFGLGMVAGMALMVLP